jgi:parallel beta-helix repeat protein
MLRLAFALAAVLAAGGCGDNHEPSQFPTNDCSKVTQGSCVEITGGDAAALQTAANTITANSTIVLGAGRFMMDNQVTIRSAGAHVIGQGIDVTTLDFSPTTTQVNGVDAVGDGFLIQDLTVVDVKKDGIRVEASNGVVYRRIRVTATTPSSPSNGAYGIYPVNSQNVLVENSVAENASDAGLYVGQCQHVVVRNNRVTGNVAGLEIENTQYADVYGNTAEDNTGGILIFDLPGNPVIGRDIRMHDNIIRNNNHLNFGTPGTTVASIPVGTGTFALASRRVEITNNTYENNNTGDISILSGLAIDQAPATWQLATSTLRGTYTDLGLTPGAAPGTVMNFRAENILVANNHHSGSGQHPDPRDPLQIGLLLLLSYAGQPVDNVLYDAIGEPEFHSTDASMNSNANRICIGGNTGGTFASLALDKQSATSTVAFFRPAAPFRPFDCTALSGGPVAAVVLP